MSALSDEIRAAVRAELDAERAWLEERLAKLAGRNDTDPEEALPLVECARLSGYSVDTLRRAIRKGKLSAQKGEKEWRVKRGDLDAWKGKPKGPPSVVDERAEALKMLSGGRGRP